MSALRRGVDRLISLSLLGSALTLIPARQWYFEVNDNLGGYYLFAHLLSFPLFFWIYGRNALMRASVRVFVLIFLIFKQTLPISPFLKKLPDREGSTLRELHVVFANVYGQNAEADRLYNFVNQNELPDILAISELSPTTQPKLNLPARYPYSHEIVRSDNFGIGLYSKFPFIGEIKSDFGQDLPPAIAAKIELQKGIVFDVVALHPVPPLQSDVLYRNKLLLRRIVTPLRHDDNVIVLGDFNATPHSEVYEKFYDAGRLRDAAWGFGLFRTWNAINPLIRLTIDHIFYKGQLRVKSFEVGGDIGSDHFPLSARFELTDR